MVYGCIVHDDNAVRGWEQVHHWTLDEHTGCRTDHRGSALMFP
jgi:hypothetical protein